MKICLIGNNLTSLILAYILSKKNLSVEIYTKKTPKINFITRTIGISKNNFNFLKSHFKIISKISKPIDQIKVLIKNKKIDEKITFNKNTSTLFYMVKYDRLISAIKSKVKKNKNIYFKYIKKDQDLLKIKNSKKKQLIINCEKSNILTEKFLIKGIIKNYSNKAFTTIIYHKKKNNTKATQIFTEYGPIAFLPLSNNLTSVVFSIEMKKKKNISENEIIELIKKYNPIYQISSFDKVEKFDLNLKLPKKYCYENLLFFGDSIHSIHPLAGQGFNMTIRDIIRFIDIIDKKKKLGLDIDKYIIKEFETKSKSQNFVFSFGIDFIYEFFRFNKNYVPKDISEKIFSFVNKNKVIKDISMKLADRGNL